MSLGGQYALIHMFDPARAAQYAALLETHDLTVTQARSEAEARFQASRLGQAALIVSEVTQSPGGFELLRSLRRGRWPQTAPTVVISGSLKVRDEALRLREQLGIVEILAGFQPLSIVSEALVRAIGRGLPGGAPAGLPQTELPGPNSMPSGAETPAGWNQLLEDAAREIGAPMAVAWFQTKLSDEFVGWFGWERSVTPMVGAREEWAPFRNLAAATPVTVSDAEKNSLLRRSPLVAQGVVRSFAGAPLRNDAGEAIGAFWLAHERPGAFSTDSLEAIAVWAQRIGAARDAGARAERSAHLQPKPAQQPTVSSLVPAAAAMAQLLAQGAQGYIATDTDGRIAFANPATSRLLVLRNRNLNGCSRARLLDIVCRDAGLDPETAAALANAQTGEFIVRLCKPHRVLRWETKPIPLGSGMGRMDQLLDITAEVQRRASVDRMVCLDPLTWLANRRGFQEAMAREVSRALRFRSPLALALFRIDPPEESPRDAAQSELALRNVAWLLAESIRGYDQGARLEDDVLAMILPGASAAEAQKLADRLVSEVAQLRSKPPGRVTLSAGIAHFDAREDVAQTVARARAAMLEAAACGGNGVLQASSEEADVAIGK